MQDKFYILKPSVDKEETGHVFPAVESYKNYDFSAHNSVHKLNHHEFPNFVPDIRFKLAKGAKLCDVMGQATISASGLLVSESLKNSIKNLNIAPHKFYSATIENDGYLHQYYWLHIVWKEIEDLIDYSNSIFFKSKFSKNLGNLNISSREDFWVQKKQMGNRFLISYDKISLYQKPIYDIYTLPFRGDIICNHKTFEQLKNKKKYKGIELTLTKQLDILGGQA